MRRHAMRRAALCAVLAGGAVTASGCVHSDAGLNRRGGAEAAAGRVEAAMLRNADPAQAVAYYQGKARTEPDKLSHRRGLARSLSRAGRSDEALLAWSTLAEQPDAAPEDHVGLAAAMVRANRWPEAKAVLDAIPPSHATYERYRTEAVVADSHEDWTRADSFYETAAGLTDAPAGILNNWGYSKLSRGDLVAAERLFTEAITNDPTLFTAKNNLVLARAERGTYALPSVPATASERAQMLHTAARAAMRHGASDIARSLLERAIEIHPLHFEPAHRALADLEA